VRDEKVMLGVNRDHPSHRFWCPLPS